MFIAERLPLKVNYHLFINVGKKLQSVEENQEGKG
jgi:hypothetical protein